MRFGIKLTILMVLIFVLMTSMFCTISFGGNNTNDAQGEIEGIVGIALFWFRLAGFAIAVIVLALIGIQWFIANPQQKAQIKEKMWGYVLGAVLAFGGPIIFGWIIASLTNIFY